MCSRGQVLGLEDPQGQNAMALTLALASVIKYLASAVKSMALEIKYYHFFFCFKLLSSLFGERNYGTVHCLIQAERT